MSILGRLLLLVVVLLTLCVPRASVASGASHVSVDRVASIQLGSALAAEVRTALSPAEQPIAPELPPLLWLGSPSWSVERSTALLAPAWSDGSSLWRNQRVGPFNRERGPPHCG